MSHPLNPDARALEEAFFARENSKLLERMRERAERAERRAALREVAPHADDALLDHLIDLGIRPETALAMVLVPLAVVAWADGSIDARERAAILSAAEERGVAHGSPGHALLETWLSRPPGPEILAAWKRYIDATWSVFNDVERRAMRERMLGLARGVAEAAGGILGIRSVSAAERAALDELEQALP